MIHFLNDIEIRENLVENKTMMLPICGNKSIKNIKFSLYLVL